MKSKPAQKSDLDSGQAQPLESPGSLTQAGPPIRLKRLLVALDFSPASLKALEYALGLAERFGAGLILLHVVEPAVYPENYKLLPQAVEEINQNLVQTARERLETLSKKRAAPRAGVDCLVRLGHAHSEIPDTAQAMAADLIILGTHGKNSQKQVFLGSTAERVVRQAACPVLTIPHTSNSAVE